MDTNECNINHLDADVLLPPRKRLLAGLKKQSRSKSMSQCSRENKPSPSPSPLSSAPLSGFDLRVNKLLKSYKNGSNMSPQEIVEAAGLAAAAAAKAAQAARAAAEERASIASKAVAVAKSALDLVVSMSKDMSSRSKHQKKKKSMKHVPVELLYRNNQLVQNRRTDEELARRLHRAMNSSSRISNHCLGSEYSNRKYKQLKISPPSEESGIAYGTSVGNDTGKLPLAHNGAAIEVGMHCERSNEESYTTKVDDKVSKSSKHDEIEVDNCEAESNCSKGETLELYDMCASGRKRGRTKQKKLPLSTCRFKDQANAKEELNLTNTPRADKSSAGHVSSLSVELRADNIKPRIFIPTWKC